MQLEILRRRCKWMLPSFSGLYFWSPHCKREIQCLCFGDIIDTVASKAWTQCKIWNLTSDLVACFRFCVSDRREEEWGKEIQISDWASDLVAYFRFCVSERERAAWGREGKRNWELFFGQESLTEATSVSNIAEVDLRWNWCVILIDVTIFNWAK